MEINLLLPFAGILLSLISSISTGIVERNLDLEVTNGRTVYIRKSHLRFATRPGEVCKVQVVQNEPIYQRVGEFTPKVFDCDYLKNSLKYQHNGSPLLSEDSVKLRVNRLLVNETIQETFYLKIRIIHSECDVIKIGRRELVVPEINGVSNTINKDILQFNYDRMFNTKCQIRIETTKYNFPQMGQLVVKAKQPKENREYEPTGVIISDCDDFLLKEIRYQHLVPPTPDVDYIPLLVTITDKRSRYVLKQEQHWLPVRISGAFPNEVPRPSYSNINILEVDQFVTTNILSMTMSASDLETDNDKLIFNITRPPKKGFITHLNDESKPVESFYQKDIGALKIAYQPPNTSFSERETFIVEFRVYDSQFGVSQIIQVMLSVRVSHTTAPRISWNMGLTMLEGQSRCINKDCLQIMDSDSISSVRITLAGGLQHGRLYVDNKPGYSFSWSDIESNKVIYKHDDSDTTRDYIMFQVSDGFHSTRFKLPVEILPKDDSPPVLVNNIVFEVAEGQIISIYHFMLEAYDQDSSSDYIKFNITSPPKAGQIMKIRQGERAGWEVQKFDQKDLNEGNIYYKHMGDEAFDDSFDFVLMDSHKPYPNISPTQTVSVKITPVDDQPPKPVPGITRSLTINETDVAFITPEMLSYIDEENLNSEIKYILTTEVELLSALDNNNEHNNKTDAGHLFYADDMIMLMKAPSVPKLKMFSQHAVNHNKVVYMPPMQDIGLSPMDVHFEYSVTDEHGTTLTGEQFFITVLPVDNQSPTLSVKKLKVQEGGTVVLSVRSIQLKDVDTEINQLKFILNRSPKNGFVEKYGKMMTVGDTFTYPDIDEFGILYTHNGQEAFTDTFELIATDGFQNSTPAVVDITILPVDDERPVFGQSTKLRVNESGSAIITSNHLRATDLDTDDQKLIFQIAGLPQFGEVLVDEEESVSFTQQDVIENRVKYQHNGIEIGYTPTHDIVSFIVFDKDMNYEDSLESLYTGDDLYEDGPMETLDLNITIYPVDDRPPNIILGSAIFNCDEGGRHELTPEHLWANDLDTPQENLVFKISPPEFGRIEDNTPREGYEKQISVPVTSFTLQKLQSGNIFYVQSKHRGIEPTADTFLVHVSDGKHQSAEIPFLIAIVPTNDELPEVRVSNFSCGEGGMYSLSESVLTIVDLDIPADEVMISVESPPNHGMLIDEMELQRAKRSSKRAANKNSLMNEMEHVSEFSLNDWSNHRIQPAYVHDGSETANDNFQLKVSDGKNVLMKEMGVNVVLVNDEKPAIVTNKGLTLELGDTEVLSNVVLYSTDADSSKTELFYILHSIPTQGKLQVRTPATDEWTNLQVGDSFTEEDVSNNWVQYVHSNVFSTKGRDSFRFSVTDGSWTTKRQNFEITIKHKEKSTVHVVTNPATVDEGNRFYITTDILSAKDGFDRPEDISYEIISDPMLGQVEHISDFYTPIKLFTQLDLMARKIVYRHMSLDDSVLDSFTVAASNGINTKEAVVTVQIETVDDMLPLLVLFAARVNRNENSYLTVFRGSSVTINIMTILISDNDTPKNRVRIVITSFPEHGNLILNGETLSSNGTFEVTQLQLQNSDLMYENNGDMSEIDRFSFIVTDGVHEGYMVDDVLTLEPSVFNIKVEQIDDTPPSVTYNIPTRSINPYPYGSSSRYAVFISARYLAVSDGLRSDHDEEILFSVTEPPLYGMIQKLGENSKLMNVSEFTMGEVSARKVLYMIDGKLNVTNDSFVFDIQDDWGNVLMGTRFSMSWSRIELVEKELTVCEGVNDANITIRRYGEVLLSSFIGVKTININSDGAYYDFVPSTAKQVQFDSHVRSKAWTFRVVDDRVRERKEKFKIVLHSPVDSVLEPLSKEVTVTILDARIRKCNQNSTTIAKPRKSSSKKKNKKSKNRKRKSKKRRRNSKKRNKKKSKKPVKDEPSLSTSKRSSKRKIKYGKLGQPVTVAPDTYSSNKTHRIWKYHGLIPITIGEEDEEVEEKQPKAGDFKPSSKDDITNDELINDEPHMENRKNLNKDSFEAELLHRPDIPIPPDIPRPQHVPRTCSIYMFDRLYYDPMAKSLMRCNGASWVPWSPSKSRATTPLKLSECEKDWHKYESRCFYIHIGDESGHSWNSAQRSCREVHGAQLATISSKKHMDWLRKKSGKQMLWIGLNKKLSDDWQWTGGDAVEFTNWKGGYQKQLNKPGKLKSNNADCTMIAERKRWIPKDCSLQINNAGYVCMTEMLS
ncbi:FRAS1-related extracellular matrix protein 1-like [Styela clava]